MTANPDRLRISLRLGRAALSSLLAFSVLACRDFSLSVDTSHGTSAQDSGRDDTADASIAANWTDAAGPPIETGVTIDDAAAAEGGVDQPDAAARDASISVADASIEAGSPPPEPGDDASITEPDSDAGSSIPVCHICCEPPITTPLVLPCDATSASATAGPSSESGKSGKGGASASPRLVAHWKLDDGQSDRSSKIVLTDEVPPSSDGVYISEDPPERVSGKSGGALMFGPDRAVRMPTSEKMNLSGALTLSAWVKREGAARQGGALIAGQDHLGGFLLDGFCLKYDNANAADEVYFAVAANALETRVTSSRTLADHAANGSSDGFVHVIGVFLPGLSLKLYINGVLDAEISPAPEMIQDSPTPFKIGQIFNSPNGAFSGIIDDVQLYASALDSDQVAWLFANPGMTLPGATLPTVPESVDTDRVAYYRLDDGLFYDRSFVARDDTLPASHAGLANFPTVADTGSEPRWMRGIRDGALGFDGIDDEVSVFGEEFDLTCAVTISAWVKVDLAAGGSPIGLIAGKAHTVGAALDGYWLRHLRSNPLDKLEFGVASEGAHTVLASSATLTSLYYASLAAGLGGWVHVAGVYLPGSRMNLFINGKLDGLAIDVPPRLQSVDTPFNIGSTAGNPGFVFKGAIDEVRVYRRALSDAEVQMLFDSITALSHSADSGVIGCQ